VKALCSWCQREGRPALLGEREPLDDPRETHGICRRHQLQLLAELPSRSFPGVELLLVVEHGEHRLYEYLRRNLAGVGGVKVIVDRRRVERRRQQRPVGQERRTQERRIYRGEVSAMGYIMVRFKRRQRGDGPPVGP
jgi:hypothetical protein